MPGLLTAEKRSAIYTFCPRARRALGVIAGVLIVSVVIQAWRLHRGNAAIRRGATILMFAFAVEIGLGTLMLVHGFTMLYGVFYVAAAISVWALLVVLAVRAAMRPGAFPA